MSGRKIPLCDIRKEMLLKHKVFMKLYCDTKLSQLSRAELVDELKKIHELEDHELHESDEHMREKLKQYQRTRNLIFWHDGSSLSSHSHILIMVACLYDTAVLYTDEEYCKMSGIKCRHLLKNHFYIFWQVHHLMTSNSSTQMKGYKTSYKYSKV